MSPSGCGVWQVVSRGQYTCHTNTHQYTISLHTDQVFTDQKSKCKLLQRFEIFICLSYVWLFPLFVWWQQWWRGHTLVTCHEYYTAHDSGAGRGRGADWEWHILAAILQHSPILQICNNLQRGGTKHHDQTHIQTQCDVSTTSTITVGSGQREPPRLVLVVEGTSTLQAAMPGKLKSPILQSSKFTLAWPSC